MTIVKCWIEYKLQRSVSNVGTSENYNDKILTYLDTTYSKHYQSENNEQN